MMNEKNIKEEAARLSHQCLFGECPACPDSMSPCPVMELSCKSCKDIGVEEWIRWIKASRMPTGL